jgi:hypothetical protein
MCVSTASAAIHHNICSICQQTPCSEELVSFWASSYHGTEQRTLEITTCKTRTCPECKKVGCQQCACSCRASHNDRTQLQALTKLHPRQTESFIDKCTTSASAPTLRFIPHGKYPQPCVRPLIERRRSHPCKACALDLRPSPNIAISAANQPTANTTVNPNPNKCRASEPLPQLCCNDCHDSCCCKS